MNLHYRTATPDDAVQIQTLLHKAFRSVDSRPGWTADERINASFTLPLDFILSTINREDGNYHMAFDDENNLVACFAMAKKSDEHSRLAMFAVDPKHQRGGLGRKVLGYAEDYALKTWGVKRMDLNTLSTRQELTSWYERCGYRQTGETEPFRYEYVPEKLPDGLYFVVLDKPLPAVA